MSAYEEIRNQLSKEDKNGFSLWKKVVAGMLAGGEEIKLKPVTYNSSQVLVS